MPAYVSSSYLAEKMSNCTYFGDSCGQWIMDHGNMDYLKASHTYGDTTGTCNNDSSKQLGYGPGKVQSCK